MLEPSPSATIYLYMCGVKHHITLSCSFQNLHHVIYERLDIHVDAHARGFLTFLCSLKAVRSVYIQF